MARPLRIQYPGAFYYISQHSNSGVTLYKSDADRKVFLEILERSMTTYGVLIHGFVLLKTHYHLIAETPRGNLSEFMRHLNITYTSYFNRSYKRKGHLYGGRYKSIVFEKESYLSSLSFYLHLNPVKLGAAKRLKHDEKIDYLNVYKWSSLPGYMGAYPRYHFVTHHLVLQPHGGDTPNGRKAYGDELSNAMSTGISFKSNVIGQAILGPVPFIEKAKSLLNQDVSTLNLPASKKISQFLKQEKILTELERGLRCERDQLLRSPGDFRSITMDMLYRFAGMTNPTIGDLMGLDYTSISTGRKKLRHKRNKDPKLNALATLLEKRLERLLNASLESNRENGSR